MRTLYTIERKYTNEQRELVEVINDLTKRTIDRKIEEMNSAGYEPERNVA